MKITRHLAPDMRQALRAVREQLGPDAVILSSRRTAAGVEITAAMDFDADEMRAAEALGRATEQTPARFDIPTAQPAYEDSTASETPVTPARQMTGAARQASNAPDTVVTLGAAARKISASPASATAAAQAAAPAKQPIGQAIRAFASQIMPGKRNAAAVPPPAAEDFQPGPFAHLLAETKGQADSRSQDLAALAEAFAAQDDGDAAGPFPFEINDREPAETPHTAQANGRGTEQSSATRAYEDQRAQTGHAFTTQANGVRPAPVLASQASRYNVQQITVTQAHESEQAAHALSSQANHTARTAAATQTNGNAAGFAAAPFAPQAAPAVFAPARQSAQAGAAHTNARVELAHDATWVAELFPPSVDEMSPARATPQAPFAPQAFATHAPRHAPASAEAAKQSEPQTKDSVPTAMPAKKADKKAASNSPSDLMGSELKTLRRMLETQLAQLAWNDLSRRAPIHTEMLRELTEIGIGHELAAQVVSHLPAHADLTQARRLAIATLSQQVLVTGDRWLEDGGRVALVGPTGVGKTTTLAKLAVRWVLRHGPRDLALVAADSVRLGAQEQINTLGQLLGAPVYTPGNLEELPALIGRLSSARFILIDTPGSSQRDAQLGPRLAALSAVGPELETALVLAASTQAGAIAEVVQRFAAVNPASCVMTKVDEAASLGGMLSVLVRARLPISYMSEGQRVPEDLRPARSLELVSSAVQLAQTAGAAADEDLLRRRFGEVAHALA
jgi:flagellar biosynthesis protein FlhF